jgi:hypothetical protein
MGAGSSQERREYEFERQTVQPHFRRSEQVEGSFEAQARAHERQAQADRERAKQEREKRVSLLMFCILTLYFIM